MSVLPQSICRSLLLMCVLNAGLLGVVVAENPSSDVFSIESGPYVALYDREVSPDAVLIRQKDKRADTALAWRLLDINGKPILPSVEDVSREDVEEVTKLVFRGKFAEPHVSSYEAALTVYAEFPGLFRATVYLKPEAPFSIEESSRDVRFVSASSGEELPNRLDAYATQRTLAAGVVYGYDPSATKSTLLYWQDFGALMDYFSFAEKSPAYTVNSTSEGFGFLLPTPVLLPPERRTCLGDTYLYFLDEETPNPIERSKRFVQMAGRVYRFIKKPETVVTDWLCVADKALDDLRDPKNWSETAGKKLLGAYVHHGNRPNAWAQQEVLIGLLNLNRVESLGKDIVRTLEVSIPDAVRAFDKVKQVDPWDYFHHHVDVARLASLGNQAARDFILSKSDDIIAFARGVDYEFSISVDLDTFEIRPPNVPVYNAVGAYAYLMMFCYELADDPEQMATFLEEAGKALEVLAQKSFDAFYSGEFAPMGAVAAIRLTEATGNERWFDYAYVSLANVFLNSWLWDSDYNYSRHYSTFFGVNTLRGQTILAAMEQHRIADFVREFYLAAQGKLTHEAELLCSELLKHHLTLYRYTLPPFLPRQAVRRAPSHGIMKHDYYIPLESLMDGWQKSGQVGQEIYGMGGIFMNAANAYKYLPESGLTLYCEYPLLACSYDDETLAFSVLGTPGWPAKFEVSFDGGKSGWLEPRRLHLYKVTEKGKLEAPVEPGNHKLTGVVRGASTYQIEYREDERTISPEPETREPRIYAQPDAQILYLDKHAQEPQTLRVDINVENAENESLRVAPVLDLPNGWYCSGSAQTIEAGASQTIPVVITCPQGPAHDVESVITVGAKINDEHVTLRSYRVKTAAVDRGFRSDFHNYAEWSETGGTIAPDTVMPGLWNGNKCSVVGLRDTMTVTFKDPPVDAFDPSVWTSLEREAHPNDVLTMNVAVSNAPPGPFYCGLYLTSPPRPPVFVPFQLENGNHLIALKPAADCDQEVPYDGQFSYIQFSIPDNKAGRREDPSYYEWSAFSNCTIAIDWIEIGVPEPPIRPAEDLSVNSVTCPTTRKWTFDAEEGLRISPKDGGYFGGVYRALNVDLNTHRYVRVKVLNATGAWGILVNRLGEMPSYLQSETWQKEGIFSLDLSDAVRGEGICPLVLTPFSVAWGTWNESAVWFEWIELTATP